MRTELRSPQVVPSHRQRANSPYSQTGTLHKARRRSTMFFHLCTPRTRHSACEQSYEARKLCPATDIIDLFSFFLVLYFWFWHVTIISPRQVSTFYILEHCRHSPNTRFGVQAELRLPKRTCSQQPRTVVPCRLKWEGRLCVMLCVCIIPFVESSFRDEPIGQSIGQFSRFFFCSLFFQPNY